MSLKESVASRLHPLVQVVEELAARREAGMNHFGKEEIQDLKLFKEMLCTKELTFNEIIKSDYMLIYKCIVLDKILHQNNEKLDFFTLKYMLDLNSFGNWLYLNDGNWFCGLAVRVPVVFSLSSYIGNNPWWAIL